MKHLKRLNRGLLLIGSMPAKAGLLGWLAPAGVVAAVFIFPFWGTIAIVIVLYLIGAERQN